MAEVYNPFTKKLDFVGEGGTPPIPPVPVDATTFSAFTDIAEFDGTYMHIADIEVKATNTNAVAIIDIIRCNTMTYQYGDRELQKARLVLDIRVPHLSDFNPRDNEAVLIMQGGINFPPENIMLFEVEKTATTSKFALYIAGVNTGERYYYNCSCNTHNVEWEEIGNSGYPSGILLTSATEIITVPTEIKQAWGTDSSSVTANGDSVLVEVGSAQAANSFEITADNATIGKPLYLGAEQQIASDNEFITKAFADENYSVGGDSYELPKASATVLGGIKVGANLEMSSDGTLSATGGGGGGTAKVKFVWTVLNLDTSPEQGGSMPLYKTYTSSALPTTRIPAQMSQGNQDPFLAVKSKITAVNFRAAACRIGLGSAAEIVYATFDIYKMDLDTRTLLQRVRIPVEGSIPSATLVAGDYTGSFTLENPIQLQNNEWVGIEFVGEYSQTQYLQQIKFVTVNLECEV